MKKYYKLLLAIICLTLFLTPVIPTYAYTEEEKQQMKEWLTANGYPATAEGAQQAYQDYLNGKFGPINNDNEGGNIPIVPPAPEPSENADTQNDTGGGTSDSAGTEGVAEDSKGASVKEHTTTPSPTITPIPTPTPSPSPTLTPVPTATPGINLNNAAQAPSAMPTPTADILQATESELAEGDSIEIKEENISGSYVVIIILGIGIIAGGAGWYLFRNRKK